MPGLLDGYSPYIITLRTALSSVGLGIATITAFLCIFLCYKRRELYHMTIFRVIFSLQALEMLDSILGIVIIYADPTGDASCRVIVFLSLSCHSATLYLSVFCSLYFQAVLIHNIPLHRKWPRILLAAGTILFSLIPPMFALFIPAKTAGMDSFCEFFAPPPTRGLFIFRWLIYYVWVVLAIILGIYSIVGMFIVIITRSRDACNQMTSSSVIEDGDGGTRSSATSMDHGRPTCDTGITPASVVKENKRKRRRDSNLIIAKALGSVIWFPIMPIISLGFNTVYSIIWYKIQTKSEAALTVDRVLQFLAVPIIAMTFFLSPPVRRAYSQYRRDRAEGKQPRAKKKRGGSDVTRVDEYCRDRCDIAAAHRSLAPSPPSHGPESRQSTVGENMDGEYTMQRLSEQRHHQRRRRSPTTYPQDSDSTLYINDLDLSTF